MCYEPKRFLTFKGNEPRLIFDNHCHIRPTKFSWNVGRLFCHTKHALQRNGEPLVHFQLMPRPFWPCYSARPPFELSGRIERQRLCENLTNGNSNAHIVQWNGNKTCICNGEGHREGISRINGIRRGDCNSREKSYYSSEAAQ